MTEIGPYQIQSEIHHGKLATVYAARDSRSGQAVAVKLLVAESLNDPTIRARFQREGQIIATLNHPAIVPVLEFDEHENQPYEVMPWMAGGSLEERLAEGPLSFEDSLLIVEQLASALDAVHALGILHGDIKPSNVLFDAEGYVFLSDFGMLKLAEATLSSAAGVLLGPPAYLSPEQAAGSEELDSRSDVYMLGILFFEMLAGQLPYLAETPLGYAIQHMTIPLPSLTALRPELPAACDAVVARAVDRKPSRRYASAGDFVEGLKNLDHSPRQQSEALITASLPVRQKPVYIEEVKDIRVKGMRKSTASRLRAGAWLFIGLAALVLAVGSGLYFLGQQGIGPLAPVTWLYPTAVSRALETILPSPTSTLPISSPTLAATAPPTLPPSQTAAIEATSTLTPALSTPTLTPNFEPRTILSTQALTTTYSVQSADTFFNIAGRFQADLEKLLAANRITCSDRPSMGVDVLIPGAPEMQLSVPSFPLSEGNFDQAVEQRHLPCMQNITASAFSKDGTMLALASGNTVYGWRVGDWKPIFQLIGHTNTVRDLEFSPDGKIVATASDDTSVRLWDALDGKPLSAKFKHNAVVTSLAYAPDGQAIYSGSMNGILQSWDAQGEPLKQIRLNPIYSLSTAQGADGETLLAAGLADHVAVLKASDLSSLFDLPVSAVPTDLAFTTDGLLLASGSDVWHIPGQTRIYQLNGAPGKVSFSVDGQLLADGGQIWKISNGSLLTSLLGAATRPTRGNTLEIGAFSPTANFLLWASKNGATVWGLPESYSPGQPSSLITHVVQENETLANITNQYQVKLESFLTQNGLTCESPIFSGQHMLIPDQPEDLLIPSEIALPAITTENVKNIQKILTLNPVCILTTSDLFFSGDGNSLVSGSALWDNATGAVRIQAASVPLDLGGNPDQDLSSPLLVLSPDQKTLAMRVGNQIEIWDLESDKLQRTLIGNIGFISSLAFSPDGQTLASSSIITKKYSEEKNEIRVWDLLKGERKWVKDRFALHMQYTADGTKLISLGEKAIQIWDAENGELLYSLIGLDSQPIISPDGSRLAFIACKNGEKINGQCVTDVARVIRTDTGQISLTGLAGLAADIQSLQFSWDSQSLAGASGNGVIIWDLADGSVLHSLKVTDSKAYTRILAFSPNGNLLASTDDDHRLLFWSLLDDKLLLTIPKMPVDGLIFTADGTKLGIHSKDDISLWGLTP